MHADTQYAESCHELITPLFKAVESAQFRANRRFPNPVSGWQCQFLFRTIIDRKPPNSMDYQFAGASAVMLVVNLIYAVIAFMIGVFALVVADKWIFRKIDFEEEIKKGNLAAAVFGASLTIFVALIISRAIGR